MKAYHQHLAILLGVALVLVGLPAVSRGDSYEDKALTIAADLIVYRPAGIVLTVGGAALWLAALPVSLIAGGTKSTAQTLIETPFDFTFRRPLGTDIRDYVDD